MPDMGLLALAPSAAAIGSTRFFRLDASNRVVPNGRNLTSARTFAETLHSVRSGETLSAVVRDYLQSQGREPSPSEIHQAVQQVARANHLSNPNAIRIQQTLDLSSLASPPATPSAAILSVLPTVPQSVAALRSPLATDDSRGAAGKSGESEPEPASVQRLREPERLSRESRPRIDLSELVRRILHPDEYRAEQAAAATAASASAATGQKSDAAPWQALLDHTASVSSGYGMRPDPFTGRLAFHDGIDLAAPAGTAIRPVSAGTVTFSGWKAGYGRTVVVRHADGTESSYSHASSTCVNAGDRVTEKTMIARVGTTGRSTGPHLHFQVSKDGKNIDPEEVFHPTNLRLARR